MDRYLTVVLFALFPLHVLYGASDEDIFEKRALAPKSTWNGSTLFESVPSSRSGVDVVYELDESHELKRLYPYGWATGNVAIGDLDGDGKADLFFPGTTGDHRLFLQRDNFQFEDASSLAQIKSDGGWGTCALLVDLDEDGDLDIYVVNYNSPNQLFMNITRGGVLRFTEMASDYGLDIENGALSASFVDYDNDGFLDLYLQTYHIEPKGGRPDTLEYAVDGPNVMIREPQDQSFIGFVDQNGDPQWVEAPLADKLYRNNGKGKFFSQMDSNIGALRSYTNSHTWWDMDADARADLYLAHDSHGPDVVMKNSLGAKFGDITTTVAPYTPWHSRGGVAADFNNDLYVDFLATGSVPLTHRDALVYGEPFRQDIFRVSSSGGALQVPRNTLFANTGTSRFVELGRMAGLDNFGSPWAVKAADYDGDGFIDLFVATGDARDWTSLPGGELAGASLKGKTRWDILKDQPTRSQKNLVYRNRGNWKFEESGAAWGLDHEGISYAAGHGDLDNDGDLDLVVCNLGEPVRLYRNHSQADRAVLDLNGKKTNRQGIGSELLVKTDGQTTMQQLFPHGGFKNSDEAAFFLSVAKGEKIERITNRWPGSGALSSLADLESGFRYTLKEVFSLTPSLTRPPATKPFFAGSGALAGAGYPENPFNNYTSQPFLPAGLSRMGPSISASDLDGDGLSEILIGGSSGLSSRLIARSTKLSNTGVAFAPESGSEDAASVFFDADSDGDIDVFVASGGIEAGDNVSLLNDRLYAFSKNQFTLNPASVPKSASNSSAVAAADFDRDGDVDVFVGGHFKEGAYPLAGESRLLISDGKASFRNGTEEYAAGLATAGAVTSAIWSDVNNDGWLDLLLATDFGSIQVWRNDSGKLTNVTASSGLEKLTGRWNAITGGDIDNDGDIDYLVANEGLSSRDISLYRADFLKKDIPLTIEVVQENGTLFPTHGWLDFAEIDNSILEKADSPAAFMESVFPGLFGAEAFAEADRWDVATRETGVLVNDGSGLFTFVPLPKIAQVSQTNGCVITDVNYDGRADIYLIQNRGAATVRKPEPNTAGISQLLLGTRENGVFAPVAARDSGLVVFGAGRGLITTDLNQDDRVDFVATLNDADPATFINQVGSRSHQPFKVAIDSPGKHPAGVRVTVEIPDFPTQTAEYYAGGGYRSQSSPELFFGAPKKPTGPGKVTFRWADGSKTNRTIYFE